MLLKRIDKKFSGKYTFFYLPIDFKNKCSVGYAFIDLKDVEYIKPFYLEFNNKKWGQGNSNKVIYYFSFL